MQQLEFQSALVAAATLRAFGRDVLVAEGLPLGDADYVAWHLVETNLRGTDSHGIARLPHYVRRLRAGSINSNPAMRFERRASAAGLLHGDQGFGHLIMRRAADEAAAMALESGAGWVTVRDSSHCGALAPFGLSLAERGFVSFVFTHVDPMVLPYGSIAPFCGTNPLCIAAPGAKGKTLCLDMATSVVPWNVVANAQRESVPIPRGWAVDADGRDTTDAAAVHALYPFGEHKGSGLGIMIDLLCAMLSGAPSGPDIPRMYGDLHQPRRLGGLIGAINIAAFTDLAIFRERIAEMALKLGQLSPASGFVRVKYPGEPELEVKVMRQAKGIPVGLQVLAELNDLASAANIAPIDAG